MPWEFSLFLLSLAAAMSNGLRLEETDGIDGIEAKTCVLIKKTDSLPTRIMDLGADENLLNNEEKMENKQYNIEVRKPKCKAKTNCVLLAGYCVSNSTLCDGRLVQECKGRGCYCCVPDSRESMTEEILNMKTLLSDVKMELNNVKIELSEARNDQETFLTNITNSNSAIVMELGQLNDNQESLLSDVSIEFDQAEDNQESLINSVKLELNQVEDKVDNLKIMLGCPEVDGSFYVPGSGNECFKFISTTQTWEASKILCQSQGLQLAKPDINPVAVRKFIVDHYFGDQQYGRVWLGGRGTGQQTVEWTDGSLLSLDSPFWIRDGGNTINPATHTATNYCLDFMTHESWMDKQPDMPYWMNGCANWNVALCELV